MFYKQPIVNKIIMALTACAAILAATACGGGKAKTAENAVTEVPKVYFIKDITSENIMKLYNALGRKAEGKKVAIKLSTGEAGNPNHLDPNLIKELVRNS